jgi:hypothetical protein
MTINSWLEASIADAKRRGLPELEPLLRALAKSTEVLRNADFAQHPGAIVDELVSSRAGDAGQTGPADN